MHFPSIWDWKHLYHLDTNLTAENPFQFSLSIFLCNQTIDPDCIPFRPFRLCYARYWMDAWKTEANGQCQATRFLGIFTYAIYRPYTVVLRSMESRQVYIHCFKLVPIESFCCKIAVFSQRGLQPIGMALKLSILQNTLQYCKFSLLGIFCIRFILRDWQA